MTNRQRTKLHFGPYRTPRFQYGTIAVDELRGSVKIVGLTDARIQWPMGKKHGRKSAPVLYDKLAAAIGKESSAAVSYWFGLSTWRVGIWRSALGVPQNNPGTLRLRQANGKAPWFKRAQKLAWAKARDPVRIEKIAASKRGKPRPPELMEKLRKANLGRKLSAEHRRKLSEAHRRRRTIPPVAAARLKPRERPLEK